MLNPLTLSNINRFSKFFHCQNEEKLCNNIITKDPTTPQVCRYTMLWNVSVLKATIENTTTSVTTSSSSSREARLTVNITVNMFSASIYYLTSVQDASATPGPCSKTAHHHTLLGTHWRTCGVRTSCSSSLGALEVFFYENVLYNFTFDIWHWHVAPKQPGLESSWLRCWMPFSRWSINVDDSRQSTS